MLVLERKENNEVYCDGKKLTIIKQESKGSNKEVVKIIGLDGSNGQQYVSLSKLKVGFNEIECKARVTSNSTSNSKPTQSNILLTQEEKSKYDELKKQLDELVELGKSRYVPQPNPFDYDLTSEESKLQYIEDLEKFIKSKKEYVTL